MDIKGNNLEKPTGKIYFQDLCEKVSTIKNYEKEETIDNILKRLTEDYKPGDIISEYFKVSREDIISKEIDIFETTIDPVDDETINYLKYVQDNDKNKFKYYVIPTSYYISPRNNKIPEYLSSIHGYFLEDYLAIQEIDKEIEKIAREKYGNEKELDKLLKLNPRSYKFELESLKKNLAEYYLYNPWQLKEDYFYCHTMIIKSGRRYYIMPEVMESIGIGRNIEGCYCMYIGEEKDIIGTKVDINTSKFIAGFYISSQNRKMIEKIGNPYSCGFCYERLIDEPEYLYCLCRAKYEDIINPVSQILKVKRLELVSLRTGYKRG